MSKKDRKKKQIGFKRPLNPSFFSFCAILLMSGFLVVAIANYFTNRQFKAVSLEIMSRGNILENYAVAVKNPVFVSKKPSVEKGRNNDFGLSVGETMLYLGDAELARRLDDMALLGLGWLRFDIDWSRTQPNGANDFHWERVDRFVDSANERGFNLVAVVGYTPKWALPSDCPAATDKCYPANIPAFKNFAAAAAKHYSGRGIKVWEIWNEPNLKGYWEPAADVNDYAALLKAAATAIKDQDPAAMIITGGMGPAASKDGNIAPVDFLAGLYKNGAAPYFDAVGHHPYSFPARPSDLKRWSGWSQIDKTTPSLRSVMADNGDGDKQIWLTEFGAPTNGTGPAAAENYYDPAQAPSHVTEEYQSRIFSDAIRTYKKFSGAGPLFFYGYKDLGESVSTNENFFGIIRFDGSKKPAYETIKEEIAEQQTD